MQQTTSASSASVTPTTSASSTGSGNAGGLAHASTADSPHPGMMTTSDTPAVLPPRRRLVKSAAYVSFQVIDEFLGDSSENVELGFVFVKLYYLLLSYKVDGACYGCFQ